MRTTKLRLYPGFWDRKTVERRSNCLFVFGDNDVHKGAGGQAIIRGLPNSIGIPTKKYPNNNPDSFYTDLEYFSNKRKIELAIQTIISESPNYKYIVLPQNGIGTGLARLPTLAPKTYAYLTQRLTDLRSII
jgi:hypothetical protein